MGEVKRYYMMKSAVTPMADGAPCYTPLVNSKTDLHIVPLVLGSDYDALRAENAKLKLDADRYRFARALENDCWMLNTLQRVSGAELDSAIDAALAKRRGE